MRLILPIMAMCLLPLAAHAEERIIQLEGNAQMRVGGDSPNYIYRGYNNDDLIYRRLINPRAEPRNTIRTLSTNDICGGIERDSRRERCARDVLKERQKLIRKYND